MQCPPRRTFSVTWRVLVIQYQLRSTIWVPIECNCMQLPISRLLWLWFYLAPFLRSSDLLAKKLPIFPTPLSFDAFTPYVPFGIRTEVNHEETSHEAVLQWRPHYRSLSHYDMIPVCELWWMNRQTDRRMDRRMESVTVNTALCTASYADTL